MCPISPSEPSSLSAIEVHDCVEALFSEHDTTSRSLYIATIAVTIGTLAAAAMTSVDLTIHAPASLAPAVERQTLRSLSDGVVERVLARAGQQVHPSDTLVALASTAVIRALTAAQSARHTQNSRGADIRVLLASTFDDSAGHHDLQLPLSKALATATSAEWKQASIQIDRAQRARTRVMELLRRGFASPVELEAADFDLTRAREERSLALQRRRAEWASELADANQRITDLDRDISSLRVTQAARFITAPVSGTIEELAPLTQGSVLRAGDAVATISPSASLIADALVAPRDIAFVHVGTRARLLVEGYDVQEWGAAEAEVTSVAHDYTIVDNRPVFRVRLRLARPELRKTNGLRAPLVKGQRSQVRFTLGRRRLLDLVQRRARSWMDPSAPQP